MAEWVYALWTVPRVLSMAEVKRVGVAMLILGVRTRVWSEVHHDPMTRGERWILHRNRRTADINVR